MNNVIMTICFNQYIKGLTVVVYENGFANPFILSEFDLERIKDLVKLYEVKKILLCGPADFTQKYIDTLKNNIDDVLIEIIN